MGTFWKRNYLAFLTLLYAAAAILLAYTVTHRTWMSEVYLNSGYYVLLILFSLWLVTLQEKLSSLYSSFGEFWTRHRFAILASLAVAVLVFLSVGIHFRVLSDEANLMGIAKGLVDEKKSGNMTMGFWYYNSYYPIHYDIPKRPLLYPYIVHLIHLFAGYRPINGFIANFLIFWGVLGLILGYARAHYGRFAAAICILFVIAQPVVSMTATSSEFDMLPALFMILSFAALYRYLEDANPLNFKWLWVNFLMLGNVRHESFAVMGICTLVLLAVKKLRWDDVRGSAGVALTPFFVFPVFWQRLIHSGAYESPPGVPAWGMSHFFDHNITFLKSFLDFNYFLPYANLINIATLILLAWFTVQVYRGEKKLSPSQWAWCVALLLSLAALWTVLTSFHVSDVTHPTSSRYATPFIIASSLSCFVLLRMFRWVRERMHVLLVVAFAMFTLYHSVAVTNKFTYAQTLPRIYAWTMDEIHSLGYRNPLVISDRPGLFAFHNYGSVNFGFANSNRELIANNIARNLYDHVLVVQFMDYEGNKPSENNDLDPIFKLETISELQNTAVSYMRISKVTSVELPRKLEEEIKGTQVTTEKTTDTSVSSETQPGQAE